MVVGGLSPKRQWVVVWNQLMGLPVPAKMDPLKTLTKPMVLVDEPSDFEVAVRVARRLFKWNDSALAFAASSDASRALFVEWIKREVRDGVV